MALVMHSSARSRLSAPAAKLNGRAAGLGPLANGIWLLIWRASSGATGRTAVTSGRRGRRGGGAYFLAAARQPVGRTGGTGKRDCSGEAEQPQARGFTRVSAP